MKNIKRNSFLLFVISIIILYFILKDNFFIVVETFLNANLLWIFVAIIFYVMAFLCDTYSLYRLALIYNKKYKFIYAIRLNAIAKFFNGITPFAIGSQPMQVVELHKKEISYSDSVSICAIFFMMFQIALLIIGTIAIIFNFYVRIFAEVSFLKELTIVGYIINLVVLFLLFLVSFSKKFNKKIISFLIFILSKIKIIKNIDEKNKFYSNKCDEIYDASRSIIKNKKPFIIGVIMQCFYLGFIYIIPLFITFSIGTSSDLNIINTIFSSAYVYLAGSYVPIPGGTGGMEFAFIGFFSNFIIGSEINSILLLWRFITYYLPVIVGGIIFNFNFKNKSKD